MHSWIAASVSPAHRRRDKDARRKSANLIAREHKQQKEQQQKEQQQQQQQQQHQHQHQHHHHHHHSGADNLDPDLLCKILQSKIIKDGSRDPSRPSSFLSPSYNTLSKSCEDMSKCGSGDAGFHREEVDKVPMPLETIIHDKRYVGLIPAAYVSRSKSHNDIIIHRRLVNPNRSKTANPNSLPSAYMEERYVIRIKKGVHPHKLHKSSSDFLKPTNELCRSLSAHNLNAETSSSSHGGSGGSGSGGNHHRHEIITTFGCSPNSAPSSREVSPESVSPHDSANGNFHQHHPQHQQQQHHHQHHQQQHNIHHQQHNTEHQSEKKPGSPLAQEQTPLLHNNNNNNNNNNNQQQHKVTSNTTNIAKSVEQQKNQLHLELPRPERRHSFVGGQTSYAVSIKSPIRSTDTHSFLSMDGLKKLLTSGGKKHHKEVK